MQSRWKLQDAKNQFSEVVRQARQDGPQVISLRGDDVVVVLDVREYERLSHPRQESLLDFFRASPLVGEDLDMSRS
ncbi:MAG: type II toxin-antitoxin system prevent-host-death family antitoxin, partial [Chloroflexota bacterium]